jgi:hypothetical protein
LIAVEAAPRGVENEAANTDGNREHEKQSGHAAMSSASSVGTF